MYFLRTGTEKFKIDLYLKKQSKNLGLIKYNPLLYLGKKFGIILKNILRLQAYFIFLCVVLGIFYLVPGSLNKKNYEQVMSRSAYNYNLLNWIYENVPKNSIVVSNAVRSHALYKNQFVSREGFFGF